MSMQSDDENAVDMVKFGFTEETRNLHFRVTFPVYGETKYALEAIRSIGGYNDFDGDIVADAIEPFLARVSYPGVEVGREGSPVIYITLQNQLDVDLLYEAMRQARADELDWSGRDNLTLRCWWD